jgi:cell division protein FtsW
MLFVSGTSLKWIAGILGIIMISLVILVSTSDTHSYLKKRINTFINPSENAQSSSWQLQQCLIAVGSGGFSGRGLGQSIQKLTYLPEPQGDSIFCVIGEELGFLGSTTIIFLFLAFMLRGYRIALRNAEDSFGKLIVIGFITIITAQSFLNISAMIGVLPLTGVPLVFFSHGGTALLLSLFMVGIILNVSRGQIKTKLEKS